MTRGLERAVVSSYETMDLYGSPAALHKLVIAGQTYHLVSPTRRKWVFKGDTINFDYEWDEGSKKRHILGQSVTAYDRSGAPVTRGSRFHVITPRE
jgi:hypothetical protein